MPEWERPGGFWCGIGELAIHSYPPFLYMAWYWVLAIIVATSILVIGAIYWLIPTLIKRGINVSGILRGSSQVLGVTDNLIDVVKGIMPGVAAINIVDKVIEYAQKGVEAAEQMYKSSQLEGEERKQKATEMTYKLLEAAGIKVDEEKKAIVDGAIESSVYALKKTHTILDAKTKNADANV